MFARILLHASYLTKSHRTEIDWSTTVAQSPALNCQTLDSNQKPALGHGQDNYGQDNDGIIWSAVTEPWGLL